MDEAKAWVDGKPYLKAFEDFERALELSQVEVLYKRYLIAYGDYTITEKNYYSNYIRYSPNMPNTCVTQNWKAIIKEYRTLIKASNDGLIFIGSNDVDRLNNLTLNIIVEYEKYLSEKAVHFLQQTKDLEKYIKENTAMDQNNHAVAIAQKKAEEPTSDKTTAIVMVGVMALLMLGFFLTVNGGN